MTGSTARVTARSPNTLASNTARTSAPEASSTAPRSPRRALLTRTSMRPKRSTARAAAARACASSVTSSATTRSDVASPARFRSTSLGLRAVATTASPRSNACRAISSPNPRDAPVTNHTSRPLDPLSFLVMTPLLSRAAAVPLRAARDRAIPAPRRPVESSLRSPLNQGIAGFPFGGDTKATTAVGTRADMSAAGGASLVRRREIRRRLPGQRKLGRAAFQHLEVGLAVQHGRLEHEALRHALAVGPVNRLAPAEQQREMLSALAHLLAQHLLARLPVERGEKRQAGGELRAGEEGARRRLGEPALPVLGACPAEGGTPAGRPPGDPHRLPRYAH